MKKVIFLAILSIILFSCSNQSVVEKNIKEYLRQNLLNFASYDPIEFGDLRPNIITFDDSEIGKPISDKYFGYRHSKLAWEYLKDQGDPEKLFELGEIDDSIKFYNNKINEYKPIYDKASRSYKEYTDGYIIFHKFRCADKGGSMDIRTCCFILDSEFKVLKME
jgi:hypothetical protein